LYYIGIDVGLTGSICILDDSGKLSESIKMPVVDVEDSAYKHWYDPKKILEIFQRNYPAEVILEYQRPMTGQGISTTFRLGRGFGLLEGLTSSIYYNNVYILDPKRWQNTLAKKYLSKQQIISFVKKSLDYDYILSTIEDGEFKDRYTKMIGNKSTSPSKAKSLLIFHSITKLEGNIDILYKDHNMIDAYLIAKFCFENRPSKRS
jgi:hypothetical protein